MLSDSEGSERGTTILKRPLSDVLASSDAVSHRKKLVKSIPKMMIRKKLVVALGLAPKEGEECGDDPQKFPAAPEEGEERGDDHQKKPAAALEEGKECGDDGNKTPKIWKHDEDGRWNTSDGTAPYKMVPYWSKKFAAVRQHKDLGFKQIIPVNIKHATMEENTEICETLIEELNMKSKSEDDVKLLFSHMKAVLEEKIATRGNK